MFRLILISGILLLETANSAFPQDSESKGSCVDKYSICSYWARQGECQKNKDYMMDNCKRSCFFCGDLECDVGIAGAGISGLYMAYKLLVKKVGKVCVFERDNRIGGRIFDHAFKQAPDIHAGLGGWRIDKSNHLVLALLKELGIPFYDLHIPEPTLFDSRGTKANNFESLKKVYPNLLLHPVFGNMSIFQLLDYALKPEHLANASNFATVKSYLSHYVTPEGATYISEFIGVQLFYDEFVNIDFLVELRWHYRQTFSWKFVRPLRGVSEIPKALSKRIVSLGGKIFTNNPVKRLIKKYGCYFLITPMMRARAKKLVIALTPLQILEVKGNIAQRIKQTAQLKSIKPVQGFRAAAVYATQWWKNVTISGTPVVEHRMFYSYSSCLGASFGYGGRGPHGETVLNTVYVAGSCPRKWRDIMKLGKEVVDREIHRAMEMKYGLRIPKPLDTMYKYWEVILHFQKPGFNFTMKDISKWATRPLPEEDVFLVNEAFSSSRGWCEGSLQSCQSVLKEGWER